MTKSNLWRKEFISFTVPYNCSSSKAVRTGTYTGRSLEAGADAEAWRGAAYWLTPHGSLIHPRTPGMVLLTVGRVLQHQSLIKKHILQLTQQLKSVIILLFTYNS